uniref:Neurogenic locus notch homolog protein 2-like n=1 Tax=Salarias fasciatus TaxID=181472 RepID=A0A672IXN3_SALFA
MEKIPGFSSGKSLVFIFCFVHLSLALQCVNEKEPCINNATCLTFSNGTEYCRCASGFLGEYCQHKDPCHPGYCLNGGNCSVSMSDGVPVPSSASCTCPLGFTGQHCQTPQNSTCYPNNPCTNRGVCTLLSLEKYKCECARGWTGPRCEHEDSCLSSPCANGGKCSSHSGGSYTCSCPQGYKGPRCLNDTDECEDTPTLCQNEGVCVNTPGSYKCNCAPGFTGQHCESSYVPCSPSPCQNGGTCYQSSETSYTCHCLPGFNGSQCENNIDDCPDHQCANGGTCMDGVNTYNCQCPPEWTGQHCTDDVDECHLQPNTCQNGGTCSNVIGSYVCVCVNGWSGPDCSENIDDCATAACSPGSTCIDRVASFICLCPRGKTGLLCHLDDACISNPCREGSQCDTNPISGMFNCNCPPGYVGNTCNTDRDECSIGTNPCEHGGQCVNTDGSFTCNCVRGYAGPRCEQDVNECASNPCQNDGTCLDRIGDYTCICMPGKFDENLLITVHLKESKHKPAAFDLVKFFCELPFRFSGEMCQIDIDECSSTPCLNGAKCIDRPNGYDCECAEGFTGLLCEENINDCIPAPCHHGVCKDGISTFSCECNPGYIGSICHIQVQECYSNPCQNGGRCIDLVNAYQCNCLPGTSGVNCEINEDDCASNPCEYGECQDGINEYKCVCASGYTGTKCDVEINECISNPCMSGGTCVDQVNGFHCLCPPSTHGPLCLSGTDHCVPKPCIHGECIEQQHGYLCECEAGWVGQQCDQEKDECQPSPCQNGGTCVDRHNGYTCQCQVGFRGVNCEKNIDECASGPCLHQGICIDGVNSYTCQCNPPFTGKHCEVELVPCASHPCERGVCRPTADYTSYTCRCPAGWQGTCDVNECKKNPCKNGGRCINSPGSYMCKCQPGYSGQNCQTDIDDCSLSECHFNTNFSNFSSIINSLYCLNLDLVCGIFSVIMRQHLMCAFFLPFLSSSCLNNGTCIDGINTFSCRCRPGFYGAFCEYEQNECDSQPCKNGGTCTDGVGTYRCTCPVGYNGQNCQVKKKHLNDSTSLLSCSWRSCLLSLEVENVCKNVGRCINVGNTHQCQCQPGYMGSYCEEMVDECQSNPCRNGATCKDYQGTYECLCKPGYQGVNCEYDVDECHSKPCLHGGTCINLINHFTCACPPGTHGLQCEVNVDDCTPTSGSLEPRCLNGGQCMDGIGRYTCSCPPGFVGEHCEGDLNECLSEPCQSPGSLDCVQLVNDYQCRCRLGYAGRHCESMVDLCLSKPCHNGAVCSMNMSSVHGYTCACPPGFTGFSCGEIEGYNCGKLRCQNNGRCVESSAGHLYCQCQPGFSGPHCENEQRCPWSCENGGTCVKDPSNPYQFSCRCPLRFSGRYCENKLLTPPPPTCPYPDCKGQSGDRVCDEQCNNHECQWDGGDCSLNWKKPWENCTASVACWDRFKNGKCDKECDNSGCLFDGFECQEPSLCKYDKYCADHYQNKICDRSCYTEACGWDGLDCSFEIPPKVVGGTLILVVRLQPVELLGDIRGFLRALGALLHTNLQVKLDDNKKPMVYPYYGEEEEHKRRSRSRRELDREVIGSVLYLEIDNRECSQTSVHCFSKTDEAAFTFLFSGRTKKQNQSLKYLKLYFYRLGEPPNPIPDNPFLMYVVGVAVVVILLILVLGMLAAKRKHKNSVLWLPDGFFPTKNDKRREPVGQDDFDMKMNWKKKKMFCTFGFFFTCCLFCRLLQTEDKPLLPIPVDADVDRREWTLQHRKAADITLTPPQADLDADCLDVNVKGPDGFTPLMLASLRNGGGPDCSLHGEEEEESGGDEPGPSVISDLIAQGASLMAQTDRTGETALHLAARYARADAAKRLLDAGADPNAHDNMGRTPLHAAVAADAQGVFQILIRNRATELDARMNDGTTPLILAARLAVEGMVEELIHCHADINAVDDHGKSALHWAAAVNNVEATLGLLKNGANRDMQDNKEETPLFLAAREGSFEAAQVLLDHYSNRDITDHLDRLPRDTAQERMHHDIVRLLDQYNLVHSPHNGPNHMGGGGNSSVMCGANGAGFIGMRPGPQGKKSRRAPGLPAAVGGANGGGAAGGSSNGGKAAGGLPESSVTMSPVDSLESPHSYTGDVSAAATTTANSPPLLSSPTSRQMLPPVSHMLGQQQSWVGVTKHGYGSHMFGLVPHQMGGSHPGMSQHHGQSPMLTPMNVTMSREQLPPIVTFQMMAPGAGQAMMKQPQPGQVPVTQSRGQSQSQSHSHQGPSQLHCAQGMMYQMPEQMSMTHGLPHTLQHPHNISQGGHGAIEGQSRPLPSYPPMQSPVDKYPTPPSQHSYTTAGSEGTTPGHSAHPPSEHPYLTPSPESPDPWSSSSPHSNSDWSDVTTSPTPLGNSHHALQSSHHTHIPEQGQQHPQSQQMQQASQQPQPGNMQVFG